MRFVLRKPEGHGGASVEWRLMESLVGHPKNVNFFFLSFLKNSIEVSLTYNIGLVADVQQK